MSYKSLKDAGLCPFCRQPTINGYILCPDCRKKEAIRAKTKRLIWKQQGMCIKCGKAPAVNNYTLCQNCLSKRVSLKSKILSNISLIKQMYEIDKLTLQEIANELGVSYGLLHYALRSTDIKKHSNSEARIIARIRGRLKPSEYALNKPKGAENPNWEGGRFIKGGYIYVYAPTHPRAEGSRKTYVREHILIWEQTHGKALPEGWVIHHLNGIRIDNRPANLVALPSRKHSLILAVKSKRIQELEALLNKQGQLL